MKKAEPTGKLQQQKKLPVKKKNLPDAARKHCFKPGQSGNPRGRQKGSRNVFAEKFIKDFLADWEIHGADAVAASREEKPTEYVRIGATLLPKDFHLKMTNEAEFEKILDKFDTEELRSILAVFAKYGNHGGTDSEEEDS